MEFDTDVFRPIHLEETGRPLPVIENFRVRRVMADDDLVFLGKFHHTLEVVCAHNDGGGIVG